MNALIEEIPKVTVLMSVYNGERYLSEAIESILNQTFTDFEFLIINDGSTDSTREIITSYKDDRIRLIDNETNIGLTRSLNEGIDLAKGKYIARMDADDISMLERIEKQVEFMENHEWVAMCGGWAYVMDHQTKILHEERVETDPHSIFFNIFFCNQFFHSSVMFQKSLLDPLRYDENVKQAQDYDLWFRLFADNKTLMNIPVFLINYRMHSQNISSSQKLNQERIAALNVQKSLLNILKINVSLDNVLLLRKLYNGETERINLLQYMKLYLLIRKVYYRIVKMKGNGVKFKELYYNKLSRLYQLY